MMISSQDNHLTNLYHMGLFAASYTSLCSTVQQTWKGPWWNKAGLYCSVLFLWWDKRGGLKGRLLVWGTGLSIKPMGLHWVIPWNPYLKTSYWFTKDETSNLLFFLSIFFFLSLPRFLSLNSQFHLLHRTAYFQDTRNLWGCDGTPMWPWKPHRPSSTRLTHPSLFPSAQSRGRDNRETFLQLSTI